MALIAVDMTPIFPDGRNGGAKIFALELLKSFQTMAPDDNFLILTASWNHQELSILDNTNMSRLCVLTRQNSLGSLFDSIYFGRLQQRLHKIYEFLSKRILNRLFNKSRLSSLGVDLLFCPFTAPTYAEPGIPVVSVIVDLQHLAYPQFFSPREINTRQAFFDDLRREADRVVCISEDVRQSVFKNLNMDPQKTHVVPVCIQSRFPKLEPNKVKENLITLSINRRPYMFYPANFWPHKNHQMLLTAFGMFLSQNPSCKIDLVFTGAIGDMKAKLKAAVHQMGLRERIHFPGYLGTDQLSSVWQGCEFLILPSLYEGFGVPLLEAMFYGKAILCSNITSLPEIAQDAALYFDPRNPREIAQCLEQIINNPRTRDDLVLRGCRRVSDFDPEVMTRKYLEIFNLAIRNPKPLENGITGQYDDEWIGEEMIITYSSGYKNRFLELQIEAPPFLPSARVRVESKSSDGICQKWRIRRGSQLTIRHPLPEHEGVLTLTIKPTFRPSEFQMGEDYRQLGVICHGCWLISPTQKRKILFKRGKAPSPKDRTGSSVR